MKKQTSVFKATESVQQPPETNTAIKENIGGNYFGRIKWNVLKFSSSLPVPETVKR